jgi:hypothetical protein
MLNYLRKNMLWIDDKLREFQMDKYSNNKFALEIFQFVKF